MPWGWIIAGLLIVTGVLIVIRAWLTEVKDPSQH
jgi:hypothetical protein